MSLLEVTQITGLATLQDGGRPGHMHEGVPRGGPLAPDLFARANAAVGNPPGTAAIELFGRMSVQAHEALMLATEDGVCFVLVPGATREVPSMSSRRVRYLAVRGGFDVPPVLGGRGTLVVAGLGGLEGRALRRGDRLPVGQATSDPGTSATVLAGAFEVARPLRVLVGPDQDRFEPDAIELLVSSPFTVLPTSDRVGTRLDGPRLSRRDGDGGLSAPMVDGAIEVPASGQPIVLGPDHPTTGGYPVIAVVLRADLGQLGARPIGSTVRFARVSLEEARALDPVRGR